MSTPAGTMVGVALPRIVDYAQLTKPRLSSLVMVTTMAAYLAAPSAAVDTVRLLCAMVGTALAVGGANALNQYAERQRDGLMERTRDRPLPAGRLEPREALAFGLLSTLWGVVVLAVTVNGLAAALAAIAAVVYVLLYTPLKTRTSLSTLVGAVPGAIPPLIGWAASSGSLDAGAWALFAILFLWQPPHFLAIARLYREDYARAGYAFPDLDDPRGAISSRRGLAFAVALMAVSAAPYLLGLAGSAYLAGAAVVGAAFAGLGLRNVLAPSPAAHRHTFLASLLYLPTVLALLLLDAAPPV